MQENKRENEGKCSGEVAETRSGKPSKIVPLKKNLHELFFCIKKSPENEICKEPFQVLLGCKVPLEEE